MPRMRLLCVILSAPFLLTLSSCSTLHVQAPTLTLPPTPVELMQPCAELEPLPDGQMATLYLQMIRDAAQYQQCSRRQAALSAVVKYQEQVRAEYTKTLSSTKPWYQFW